MNNELNHSDEADALFASVTKCNSDAAPEQAMALATVDYWVTDTSVV